MSDNNGHSFQVPPALSWLNKSESGREWLLALPGRVQACARKWNLQLEEPYQQSFVSIVFPARLFDGSSCVLKIQWPHPESEQEAAALLLWNGQGAVRLFDYDLENHALLLERCEPGDHLSCVSQGEALEVFTSLLPQLWVKIDQTFPSLEEEALRWFKELPASWLRTNRPFEIEMLDAALAAIDKLSSTQGEQFILHQDLHGDNVLRAAREPWLAIDPKPLVGEREFSLAPIIRGYEFGHSRADVIHRLDSLTASLNLNRERARLWALAQTLAWGFEGDLVYDKHVDTARWLWRA